MRELTILDPADVKGADYPSETFRVLKNNEIRKYGEYRTRGLGQDGERGGVRKIRDMSESQDGNVRAPLGDGYLGAHALAGEGG